MIQRCKDTTNFRHDAQIAKKNTRLCLSMSKLLKSASPSARTRCFQNFRALPTARRRCFQNFRASPSARPARFQNFWPSLTARRRCLLLFRQPQPRGLHVLTLSERGLGRAVVGIAAVTDGEAEGARCSGGQQGDIDRILGRGAGDGEGFRAARRAGGMHVGLVRVGTDGHRCRLRIFSGIAAIAAIADAERLDGSSSSASWHRQRHRSRR